MAHAGRAGADVVVNLNASPYNRGRRRERLAMLEARVAEAGCAVAYVNQVGGQDELVFDGDSLVMGADGTLVASGAQFADGLRRRRPPARAAPDPAVTELLPRLHVTDDRQPTGRPWRRRRCARPLSDQAEVYAALVLGTHDYLSKNGFAEAVIGLSGGIDSSLVATRGGGRARARPGCTASPCRRAYSSDGSRQDAEAWPSGSGSTSRWSPIEEAHVAFSSMLAPVLGREPFGLTDENLQSRLRGRAAHGRVERQGLDRADHRQQERDGDRLLDALRRLGRRASP